MYIEGRDIMLPSMSRSPSTFAQPLSGRFTMQSPINNGNVAHLYNKGNNYVLL